MLTGALFHIVAVAFPELYKNKTAYQWSPEPYYIVINSDCVKSSILVNLDGVNTAFSVTFDMTDFTSQQSFFDYAFQVRCFC